jgi:peroxiredoxin
MSLTDRLVAVGAVPLLLLAAACSSTPGATGAVPDKGYVSGDGSVREVAAGSRTAPVSLSGTTIDGKPLDLADYRGKVVVVNVWGSWCDPCQREATGLEAAWAARQSKPVQFVGIDIRDQPAAARAFQRKKGITYPSLDGSDGSALLAFRGSLPPSAIPSTLVLDRQGRVAARVLGPVTERTLTGLVDDALAEPA